MRPRVRNPRGAERLDHRNSRETQDRKRQNKYREHRHLDVVRLDFLAEIFWSSANHEPGDEHCKDYKNNHAVQSRAHAPKYHFTEHDIDEWDHAAQWRKGVMHAVNRATA